MGAPRNKEGIMNKIAAYVVIFFTIIIMGLIGFFISENLAGTIIKSGVTGQDVIAAYESYCNKKNMNLITYAETSGGLMPRDIVKYKCSDLNGTEKLIDYEDEMFCDLSFKSQMGWC